MIPVSRAEMKIFSTGMSVMETRVLARLAGEADRHILLQVLGHDG